MLLFYIRHGDPIYSPDSLTPLGARQAEAVAKRLSLYGLDRIFASSSNRAQETARPASELTKVPIVELDWTNEKYAWQDYSVDDGNGGRRFCFEHPPIKKMMASEEVRKLGFDWYEYFNDIQPTFKTGFLRVRKETDSFLAELGYTRDESANCYIQTRENNERVALFAHHGFGLIFLSCVLNIPYPYLCTRFDMTHSAITVIDFTDEEGIVLPKILTHANDSHLYREGLPTKYNNRIYF